MEIKWIIALFILATLTYACMHICFYFWLIITYYKTKETDIFKGKHIRITCIAAIYTIMGIEKIRIFLKELKNEFK